MPSVWPLRNHDPLERLRSNIVNRPLRRPRDSPGLKGLAINRLVSKFLTPRILRKLYAPFVDMPFWTWDETRPWDEERELIRGDGR